MIEPGVPRAEVGQDALAAHAICVSKRFEATQALDQVSLAVSAGETHALVGRNGAGKSTLVSLLTGLVAPDSGEIRFGGGPAPPLSRPADWRAHVACVYQRPKLVPSLSVAENLFLGRYPTSRGGAVDWTSIRRQSRGLLDEWGIEVDPQQDAGRLDAGQCQLVEIARALAGGARLIILDEPTAQLEGQAIARLFERIRGLQRAGITFLYISHHLDEIYELCQRVTVLRDGRHVVTAGIDRLPRDQLIEAMVGQERTGRPSATVRPARDPARGNALEVEGLGLAGACENVTFVVRTSETVGLAGLVGSGKLGVAQAIAGLRPIERGRAFVSGCQLAGGVQEAIDAGVGYVPEDRHKSGFVPLLSVQENVTLSVRRRLGRWGVISGARQRDLASTLSTSLELVSSSLAQPVAELSGGNQQKAVLARALASDPKLIVLVHPTAGVDVASKAALLSAVGARAAAGAGVLMVSDELDELRACDRVLVMFAGRLMRTFDVGWSDKELVAAMEGVSEHVD